MRSLIAFRCEDDALLGTLDAAEGKTGLLIVSGGNEIRVGAHRGMALLAATVAAGGHPVFRFDRRGIGDSTGINRGYGESAPDIAAAAAAFREALPHVTCLYGFGNCDAATALALFGRDAGIDRLILANPWTVEDADPLPPAAAIRARYLQRLRDPRTLIHLLRGRIDLRKFASGLRKLSSTAPRSPNRLMTGMLPALAAATVVLAEGDATAIAFRDAARRAGFAGDLRSLRTASHSFASDTDRAALEAIVLDALARDHGIQR